MGFKDFADKTAITTLDHWVTTRSYIKGYEPSQADVTTYNSLAKSLSNGPRVEDFPHAWRWWKHITFLKNEGAFEKLPGDRSAPLSAYGPDEKDLPSRPAAGPQAAADDDDIDLFGEESEDDEEAEKRKEETLRKYREAKAEKEKKKGKVAAKSMLTVKIKPSGPWADLDQIEKIVRGVQHDGLTWAQQSKRLPVAYGLFEMTINMTIEDEKITDIDGVYDEIMEAAVVDPPNVDELEAAQQKQLDSGEIDEDDTEDFRAGLIQSVDTDAMMKL